MKKGLFCIFLGHFGIHNFMEKNKKKGILNIIFTAMLLILLIGSLILPILSVIGTSYVEKNKNGYVSAPEAFLAPKLFKTGTGFWDGTKKYKDVIYDTVNEVPAEFYKDGVLDLEITGEEYIDHINKYGTGGYAVFTNETTNICTFHSYETKMSSTGNYQVEINFHDEQVSKYGELAEYAVYLRIVDYDSKILLKDFSKDYSTYTLDLSKALKDNGYDNVKAELYFELLPSKESNASYVMFETIKFSANNYVVNYDELVNIISMNDANKSISYQLDNAGKKPVGYWTAYCSKGVYRVKVVKCNFTYDTYAEPYGDKIVSNYNLSELNMLRKNGYCDYDNENIKDTFVILDPDKCPVTEIIDVTYTNRKPIVPVNITCKVKGYLTYTHGGEKSIYDNPPKFIFGTNEKGISNIYSVIEIASISLIYITFVTIAIVFAIFLTRTIIFLVKGITYITNNKKAKDV